MENDFTKIEGNDVFILIDNVENNSIFIHESKLVEPVFSGFGSGVGIDATVYIEINKHINNSDFLIFETSSIGITLLDSNTGTIYLNGKQERTINKKLEFWPPGKDYPYWGYLIIFKTEAQKVLFELSKGFGLLK